MREQVGIRNETESCPKCKSKQVHIYKSWTVHGDVYDWQCANPECRAIRPESLPPCLRNTDE